MACRHNIDDLDVTFIFPNGLGDLYNSLHANINPNKRIQRPRILRSNLRTCELHLCTQNETKQSEDFPPMVNYPQSNTRFKNNKEEVVGMADAVEDVESTHRDVSSV